MTVSSSGSSSSNPDYPPSHAAQTVASSSSLQQPPSYYPSQSSWSGVASGYQQSDYDMTPATPIPPPPIQQQPVAHYQAPVPPYQPPAPERKGLSTWAIVLLAAIALILFSTGGYFFYDAAVHRNATTTAANATATAQGRETATLTNQTASANSQATANAATATVQTNATATVQSGATATVVVGNPDPYPPSGRTLALLDPMSQPYLWQSYTDSKFGGSCQFKGSSLHVTQSKSPNYFYCTASTEEYTSATFEVQMTMIQGDCGGITFRASSTANKLYFYRVCVDGAYDLYLYVDSSGNTARTLLKSTSPVIHKGVNQANLLAVVTNGSQIDLYVNKQKVDSINDTTYKQGLFGVVANSLTGTTEVTYSNARIWT
jgi:hypothetical protein